MQSHAAYDIPRQLWHGLTMRISTTKRICERTNAMRQRAPSEAYKIVYLL
jgi:hypothetical protein